MTESSRHMPVIRNRRAILNRHLILLTLAHFLNLVMWVELSSALTPPGNMLGDDCARRRFHAVIRSGILRTP